MYKQLLLKHKTIRKKVGVKNIKRTVRITSIFFILVLFVLLILPGVVSCKKTPETSASEQSTSLN